jgi:rsbT co-antagonist protein RsbR
MATAEFTNEGLVAEIAALRQQIAELSGAAQELAQLRAEVLALRASEAEMRAMFQAMTDVVLVMDKEGRYIKIAPTAPDLLYRPSQELLGKTLHEVMPAEPANFFLSHIRAALSSGRVTTMEYSLPVEGKEIFFIGSVAPMSNDRVIIISRDVTERRLAERARQEQLRHEEIIRAQEAMLAQLSTPLIPINGEVMVMPLVGHVDASRISRILTVLLEGVQARRARVAILDVTGVPAVDAQMAGAFVRAARAVQLLGAQVVLTGIRAEVAQALVSLQVDLRGIVTRATLQSGIAFATGGGAAG